MKKLSFCITSYHKDIHELKRLMALLSQQTVAPYEIIVYCSGVKDLRTTSNITIAGIEVPIKVITDLSPQLQTVARNTCADLCTGDTVSFFDIDDIPHPQKIEAIQHYCTNYDFVVHSYKRDMSNFVLFDTQNIKVTDKIRNNPSPQSTNLQVIPERPITHGHLTVDKKIFKTLRYDENFYFTMPNGEKRCSGEDGRFCQQLITQGFKGIFLDEPLIIYT